MKTHAATPGEDIQAIREIMERSSKFLSLSGLSGVFAGVCALCGAAFTWFLLMGAGEISFNDLLQIAASSSGSGTGFHLILVALLVFLSAALGAAYFSYRKAGKAGQHLWTPSTRRLLVHLLIPMATGGIFIMILVFHHIPELIVSVMLIFYGLSLVNAGKFTFGEIHYLGLTETLLGIIAGFFIQYNLLIWMIGFGLMHIIYGTVMYFRYDRQV